MIPFCSRLWQSCGELRGGMDASQYKDCVLRLLFVKYASHKHAADPHALIDVPSGARFADLNDEDKLGKVRERVDRLCRRVAIFEGLDFGRNRAEGDDLLGDACEDLMRHFATESGTSKGQCKGPCKGQFYTPAEGSRVVAQVRMLRKPCIAHVSAGARRVAALSHARR